MTARGRNKHLKTFVEKNVGNDGCWIWLGAKDKDGYGRTKYFGVTTVAHRALYRFVKGDVPAGLYLCHRCDHPACCNPDHLFLGTAKDNYEDAKAKGRHSHGERNGVSKLTEDDVRFIRANAASTTQMDLARRFEIRQSTIWQIINRKGWAHVQD